jgi:hypothetical protein
MKKILSLILVLFISGSIYSQNKALVVNKEKLSLKDENFSATSKVNNNYNWSVVHNQYAPSGTVPFPLNYDDYWTNGNCQRNLLVFGDTVIIGADINQNTAIPPLATDGRTYYTVSYNGGVTWIDPVNMSPTVSTRWPNLVPTLIGGQRSITSTGRIYSTSQAGVSMVDAFLGLGSMTTTITPSSYRDFWGYYKNATTLGGIISSPTGAATDSLFYYNFNYVTNTYSGRQLITTELVMDKMCLPV